MTKPETLGPDTSFVRGRNPSFLRSLYWFELLVSRHLSYSAFI